jgi:hypothetical protein
MPARPISGGKRRHDGGRREHIDGGAARACDPLIVSSRRPAQQFVAANDERIARNC